MAEKKVVQRAENLVKVGTKSFKVIEKNVNNDFINKLLELSDSSNVIGRYSDDVRFIEKGIELAYSEQSKLTEKADSMSFDDYMKGLEELFEREKTLEEKKKEKSKAVGTAINGVYETIDFIIQTSLGDNALEAVKDFTMEQKNEVVSDIIASSNVIKKALRRANATK